MVMTTHLSLSPLFLICLMVLTSFEAQILPILWMVSVSSSLGMSSNSSSYSSFS